MTEDTEPHTQSLLTRILRHLEHPECPPDEDETILHVILKELRIMSQSLSSAIQQLTADVAAQKTEIASAQAAFQGLSQQLTTALAAAQNAGATPDQLQALTDLDTAVKANTSSLASAVVTNTPASSNSNTSASTSGNTTSGTDATVTSGGVSDAVTSGGAGGSAIPNSGVVAPSTSGTNV